MYEKTEIIYLIENKQYRFTEGESNLKTDLNFISKKHLDYLLINDICEYNDNKTTIKFNFVGIISFKNYILIILPKIMNKSNYKIETATSLIKVLKKYSKSKRYMHSDSHWLTDDPDFSEISDLAMGDFIIKDYLNYGIYFREENNIEYNSGESIIWDLTISETDPFYSKGKPIYYNFYKNNYNDEIVNLISDIHRWAVSWAITNFGTLLGYNNFKKNLSVNLNESKSYLLYIIRKEMGNIFNDRKIKLLKVLYNLIDDHYLSDSSDFNLYGTNSFEHIWEEICSEIFINEISDYLDLIPKPKWKDINNNIFEKSTLEPDIIKAISDSVLFILDPKYYNIVFEGTEEKSEKKKLKNNPGVADINKQFLYEKALTEKIKQNKIYNVFLFPGNFENKLFKVFGQVDIDLFDLDSIKLTYFSIHRLFSMYINNNSLKKSFYSKLIDKLNSLE